MDQKKDEKSEQKGQDDLSTEELKKAAGGGILNAGLLLQSATEGSGIVAITVIPKLVGSSKLSMIMLLQQR